MAQKFKNFIDGKWVDSGTSETYENRNPANGNLLGIFPKSGRLDVMKAIEAAHKAYQHWRLVPAPKRGEILYKAGQLLVERKEQIAREMTMEMGKVLKEAYSPTHAGGRLPTSAQAGNSILELRAWFQSQTDSASSKEFNRWFRRRSWGGSASCCGPT